MPNFPLSLPPSRSGDLIDIGDSLEVRRSVVPLVYSKVDGTFAYHGTCFCTGYSGACLTAMHVINDGWDPRKPEMKTNGAYGVVALTGILYGDITADLFRPFTKGRFFPQVDALSGEHDPSRIGFDVALVNFDWRPQDRPEPLWVRTDGRPRVKVGDSLIVVGFDEALATVTTPGNPLQYRDRLRACRVVVQQTMFREPVGMGGGPILIFDANIPGGMSGGPVFAEDGAVVALVSTGSQFGDYGSAVWLEPYRAGFQILAEQNHDNPDWFGAWRFQGGAGEPDTFAWRPDEAELEHQRRPTAKPVRVWRSRTDPDSSVNA